MKIQTAIAANPARPATRASAYSHSTTSNPVILATPRQNHVSPDTSLSSNSNARMQHADDAFIDIHPALSSGLVQFIQLHQVDDDYSDALTHLEPAEFKINAPLSFEPFGPAATPTLRHQRSVQPRISFTKPTNDILDDHSTFSTSIIRSFSNIVTGTLRWAATVALANQHDKSQGHSPLQLNNELAQRMHRNLGFGSAGTSKTH